MAGRGIGAELADEGASRLGAVDLGKELKDTLNRVKQVADAAAVGQLVRSIAGEAEAPTKDEVDAAGKTISIAKDLTAMQSDKEKAARDEAEYWRQRALQAEEEAKLRKTESRQEELGAMQTMASVFASMLNESRQNQSEMTRLVLELLDKQRQTGVADPVTQHLAELGLEVLRGQSQRRPVEELKDAIETLRAVGIPVGQSAMPGNVTSLDAYRMVKQMELESRRLDLEAQRMRDEVEARRRQADAIVEAAKGFAAGAARAAGQAPPPQAPPRPKLVPIQCQACSTVTGVPEGTADYECPACKQRVYIQPPETGGGNG